MTELKLPPGVRTLDAEIPELKSFLKPGMKVLDVGCGSGTITLGVAVAVNPGTVMGVDPVADSIGSAKKLAAQVNHPGNVKFQVGDSHLLDFPDESFDLVYSHTVIHFFLDPVAAIKEQRRVVKKGGWVVASGVRDWGGAPFFYPPSPNWDKMIRAIVSYFEANREEHRDSATDPVAFVKEESEKSRFSSMRYGDPYAGRKSLSWFSRAGLSELRIETRGRLQYQGHRDNPPSVFDFLNVQEPRTDSEKYGAELVNTMNSAMIARGLLDEETIKLATEEAHAWYRDPGAFRFFPEFFVAGRVPQA